MTKADWLLTLVVVAVLAVVLAVLSRWAEDDMPVPPPPLPEPTVTYSSEPHGPDTVFE